MEKYKFKWSPLILLTFIVQNLLTEKLSKKNSWYEFKPFKTQWLPLFFEYPGQNLLTKNLLRIIIKKIAIWFLEIVYENTKKIYNLS